MIVVDHLRAELDGKGRVSIKALEDLQMNWDEHRASYFNEARADLRLPP
ncbi:hypothetical protein [Pseudonocardia adelaidensis]